MASKMTQNQIDAVNKTGKNVLVSASAGSGKTFVMIERIIRLILEEGVEVSNILAVTYTNLAASEMKQKLVRAVINRISEGKDVERMRRTLAEIPTSSISTLHSFCLNLLKTYFYSAGVDPDFSVADESKTSELSSTAIDGVFLDLYKKQDEDFLKLTRLYRKGRGDAFLKSQILKLYNKCSSESYPDDFLDFCVNSIDEKTYAVYQKGIVKTINDKIIAVFTDFEKLLEDLNLLTPTDRVCADLKILLQELKFKVDSCLLATDFESLKKALLLSVSSVTTKKTQDESVLQLKNEISSFKKRLSLVMKKGEELIPQDVQADLKNYLATREIVEQIVKVTKLFGEKFDELKEKEGVLTFSDLEHKTLALLKGDETVLSAVKDKYKFIFADEYQDVNGVQEEILKLISSDNLFMVGDVKQSIYAFRGCNPEIFAKKYQAYQENGEGFAIPLDKNFRSSDGVLNAVNSVFSDLITLKHGGVDYKKNPMQKGGLYSDGYGEATLHVVTLKNRDNQLIDGVYDVLEDALSQDTEEDFYEGKVVAEIIEEELEKTFYDEKKKIIRKVEPSDIAVLTRNSTGYTDEIVKRLVREGIPVISESKVNVLNYSDIKLLIDVLKLIDYFADDPPLVATLKSAIGKLTDEDLAKIRAFSQDKKATFCACVETYRKDGDDFLIKQKLEKFYEYFDQIRTLADFWGAGELLGKIMRDTGLDLEIASKNLGKIRLARVERFIAESQSNGVSLSVGEFLQKIKNANSFTATSEVAGTDAVKVMSMHASKGLEYPIVIIPGLHKKFNALDDTEEILFSRKHGVAVNYYDEDSKIKYSTSARTFFKQVSSLERANEEARVFYVAMTRAKSRLHLVTTKDVQEKRREEEYIFTTSYTDFLSLSDMPVKFHIQDADENYEILEERTVVLGDESKPLTEIIKNSLSFEYPYLIDTTLPVKSSVTAINGRQNQIDDLPEIYKKRKLKHLDVLSEEERTKTGTCYHHFLQVCDFSDKNADNQLIALLNSGKLDKEEVEILDKNLLGSILSLPLFNSLSSYKLYKEQSFITEFSARELYGENSDEKILVQGIIDLLAVKGDKAIIVDYKMSNHSKERLKKDYATQLSLYKKAVERGLKLTVENAYILSLKTGELIEVE
ncbi:MAG: UvrD-helicase domain-containing protein [Clostridia bacterium]|nr:UvrD-helicase domain-containing protein [Clostridia bacterium]